MGTPSEIRDLILQLRAVAQVHPAHSQVTHILTNAYDHMSAIARLEEINQSEDEGS